MKINTLKMQTKQCPNEVRVSLVERNYLNMQHTLDRLENKFDKFTETIESKIEKTYARKDEVAMLAEKIKHNTNVDEKRWTKIVDLFLQWGPTIGFAVVVYLIKQGII